MVHAGVEGRLHRHRARGEAARRRADADLSALDARSGANVRGGRTGADLVKRPVQVICGTAGLLRLRLGCCGGSEKSSHGTLRDVR